MLQFVANNIACYEWDTHVLLKMHGSNPPRWTATMTDVLNKGDELAIYAMCDMLKRHAFVYTRTKPWTTVDRNVGNLTVAELCMLCDVRLIYLGNNRFGELKCKSEILSPLPRLLPAKHESCLDPTISSPTKNLVVGILDTNQSSCTLLTLPTSPTVSEVEYTKNCFSLKHDEVADVETTKAAVETVPSETHPNISTDNPSSLSMDITVTDKDVTRNSQNDNNETDGKIEQNISKAKLDCATVCEPRSESVETRPHDIDPNELGELNDPDSETSPTKRPMDKIVDMTTHTAEPIIKQPSPAPVEMSATPQSKIVANDSPDEITPTITATSNKVVQTLLGTRACRVRLEILTEADIIKHVHIHRRTEKNVETTNAETVAHYTRSSDKPKINKTSRHPRPATKDVNYSNLETDTSETLSPTPKRKRYNRPKREPSSSRIKSEAFIRKQPPSKPLCRYPRTAVSPSPSAVKHQTTTTVRRQSESISKTTPSTSNKKSAKRGTFETQSYTLKQSKRVCKFGCKMCTTWCTSTKELILHHQQKHNILYCNECSKAFNNPSSLARHQYSHKELKFKCVDCDQLFAFESNLKTHRISHRTIPSHCCVYPNCERKFKNKGDLTRHAKEHDGTVHKCPDCDYENLDVRNLASHRLIHSDIEKYVCQLCGETFRFSNQ